MALAIDKQPQWTVTSQQEMSRLDAAGKFVPGVVVGFKTAGGLNGTVFVPDSQYTVDAVRTAVQARVEQMQGVAGLTG